VSVSFRGAFIPAILPVFLGKDKYSWVSTRDTHTKETPIQKKLPHIPYNSLYSPKSMGIFSIFFKSPAEGRPLLKVEGADPETLLPLGAYVGVVELGKDKNAVYMGEEKIEIIRDPRSIKVLPLQNHDYFLQDKYHLYGYDLIDKEKNIWGVKILYLTKELLPCCKKGRVPFSKKESL
jgi:hypothetical protein